MYFTYIFNVIKNGCLAVCVYLWIVWVWCDGVISHVIYTFKRNAHHTFNMIKCLYNTPIHSHASETSTQYVYFIHKYTNDVFFQTTCFSKHSNANKNFPILSKWIILIWLLVCYLLYFVLNKVSVAELNNFINHLNGDLE